MSTEYLELLSKPGVFLPMLVLGLMLALQYFKRLSVSVQRDSAEIDVIKLLRSQLKELAESNKNLQQELVSTKEMFRATNDMLTQVKLENLELLSEVKALRSTVKELETRISNNQGS
jgi:peptidoglycan hydrolase CwlO-like protein